MTKYVASFLKKKNQQAFNIKFVLIHLLFFFGLHLNSNSQVQHGDFWFQKGRLEFRDYHFDSSQKHLERALQISVLTNQGSLENLCQIWISKNLRQKGRCSLADSVLSNLSTEQLQKEDSILGHFLMERSLVRMCLGDYSYALEDISMAIKKTEVSDSLTIYRRIQNKAAILKKIGNFHEAEQSIELSKSYLVNKESVREIQLVSYYAGVGAIAYMLNDLDKANAFTQQALKVLEKQPVETRKMKALKTRVIGNLIGIYSDLERMDLVKIYCDRHLDLCIDLYGERSLETADAYMKLGVYSDNLKNDSLAIRYFLLSKNIYYEHLDSLNPQLLTLYLNLGNASKESGDLASSMYYSSLTLRVAFNGEGKAGPSVLMAYRLKSHVYKAQGDWKKAIQMIEMAENYADSVKFEETLDLKVLILEKATLLSRIEDHHGSLKAYNKVLKMLYPDENFDDILTNPSMNDPSFRPYVLILLVNKANALIRFFVHKEQNIKYYLSILEICEKAFKYIDYRRRRLNFTGEKLWLGNFFHLFTKIGTDIAINTFDDTQDPKYVELAFQFSQRSKANVLEDAIVKVQPSHLAGLSEEILGFESSLKSAIIKTENLIYKSGNKRQGPNQDELNKLKETHFKLTYQWDSLNNVLKTKHPDYFNLTKGFEKVSSKEISNELDGKTVLVEYFIDGPHMLCFLITKDTLMQIKVPLPGDLSELCENFLSSIRKVDFEEYPLYAKELYDLLIAPIYPSITAYETIVIIPDGPLLRIPFSALLKEKPSNPSDFRAYPYLIKEFELKGHYSAKLWLETKTGKMDLEKSSFIGLAPVFDSKASIKNSPVNRDLKGNYQFFNREKNTFQPLKYSKSEVEEVSRLFIKKNRPAKVLLFDRANETAFKNDASNYDHVLVATHGVINDEKSDFSGLVFFQPDSTSFEDGILFNSECFNLKLPAKLLVLSSCESGVGNYYKGEGVMAMTRGFLYAGVQNIVFSQWKIPDLQTKSIMVAFFRNVTSGKTYSKSLRNAQLQFINSDAAPFPKNWAAFSIIGK